MQSSGRILRILLGGFEFPKDCFRLFLGTLGHVEKLSPSIPFSHGADLRNSWREPVNGSNDLGFCNESFLKARLISYLAPR
jgi:hypothetical protein